MSDHQLLLFKNGMQAKCMLEVDGFTEKEVKATCLDERKLVVLGEGLKITNFSKESGDLIVSGKITSVSYRGKTEKLIKRIFK